MLVSTVLLNPAVAAADSDFDLVRSIVINHRLPESTRTRTTDLAGAPLLWSPFVLAANAGVGIARSRGSQIPSDGLSWPYRWATALATAFYAFLALSMSYRLALRFAGASSALLATITIWLASSLPVYLYALPFTAHAAAMFSAALFLTMWLGVRDGRDTRARWFLWGLAGGLAVATSLFNAALMVVALVEWAMRIPRARGFVEALIQGAMSLAGGAIVIVPALALRRQIDGSWLTAGNSPIMHWTRPDVVSTAFSAEHGALLWTPVLLIAVFGLIVVIRRQPALGGLLFLASVLFWYLVAAYPAPSGASYGGRLLLPLTPVFVCGLAALVEAVAGSRGRVAWSGVAVASALFVVWNAGLMLQWGTGLIPQNGPLDFRQAAINQVTVVPRTASDFVIRYINDRKAIVNDAGRGAR